MSVDVWPKLTAGTTEAGVYHAGLKLNVSYASLALPNAAKLDASSIQDNVQLARKDI